MEEQNNSGENIDAAPKDKNRESVDSLTEQINKNSENVFKWTTTRFIFFFLLKSEYFLNFFFLSIFDKNFNNWTKYGTT